MKDAFLKTKNKGICASVYGFHSNFFGTYYTYENGHIKVTGNIDRPYYLWVIGNKELLQKFNRQLTQLPDFSPFHQSDFGLFDKPVNNYNLLFKTSNDGTWTAEANNVADVRLSKSKPTSFAIAVDFSSLPNFCQGINYLKNNVRLNLHDCAVKLKDVKLASEIDITQAAPHEKLFLQNSTHVLYFDLSGLYKEEGSFSIHLPLKYDNSYDKWSTMDDRSTDSIKGKTFAFKYLVDGVRDAYQNNNENFVNISIKIKK